MEEAGPAWEVLLRRTRQGDEGAARSLVTALYPCVLRIVRAHRPVAMDEEDLVQEAFLKIFAKLDTFRGDQPLDHWVSRIARNLCFDHLRKQQRRGEVRYADLGEGESEVLEAAFSRELTARAGIDSHEEVRRLIEKLLSTLRPGEAMVVRMLDLEEKAVKDVAMELGWGESRVKVTAFRARRKLQETMRTWEGKLHEGGAART
jgi:RNA polymerase sigma-70 factor, ECF subfamily